MAGRAHREQLVAVARQDHRLALSMPQQHAIRSDSGDRDALDEVIALKGRIRFTHGMHLHRRMWADGSVKPTLWRDWGRSRATMRS